MNAIQTLPQSSLCIPLAAEHTTQPSAARSARRRVVVRQTSLAVEHTASSSRPADQPLILHLYVRSELRRSDKCNTAVFVLLLVAGFMAVAVAFLWPFARALN